METATDTRTKTCDTSSALQINTWKLKCARHNEQPNVWRGGVQYQDFWRPSIWSVPNVGCIQFDLPWHHLTCHFAARTSCITANTFGRDKKDKSIFLCPSARHHFIFLIFFLAPIPLMPLLPRAYASFELLPLKRRGRLFAWSSFGPSSVLRFPSSFGSSFGPSSVSIRASSLPSSSSVLSLLFFFHANLCNMCNCNLGHYKCHWPSTKSPHLGSLWGFLRHLELLSLRA